MRDWEDVLAALLMPATVLILIGFLMFSLLTQSPLAGPR
jgi:hypothetical protein